MTITRKNTYESLSPSELAKQQRRIARYIQQGMNLSQLYRLGIKEKQARDIASQFGLQIQEGRKGQRL
jgi:hypothetical protein